MKRLYTRSLLSPAPFSLRVHKASYSTKTTASLPIRPGAGPFPTEDHALTRALPDLHNTWNDWQQTFRVGHFDLVATRYARDVLVQYPQTDRKKEALRTPSLPAAQLDAEYQKKPERSSDFAPGKLDYLAVTHMDRLETIPHWQICTAYDYQGKHEDLSPYFEQEGKRPGKLTKMKVQRPVDLAHQERLTQRLWSCTPEYQMFSE